MDEPEKDTVQADEQKEWVTPELIVEEVIDVTQGGTGRAANLATEDKVTTYYHS